MSLTAKIITSFVYPPIPIRQFDWCAFTDEESGRYGWGKTEAEAIEDFKTTYCDEPTP